jgi:hypothetical protein
MRLSTFGQTYKLFIIVNMSPSFKMVNWNNLKKKNCPKCSFSTQLIDVRGSSTKEKARTKQVIMQIASRLNVLDYDKGKVVTKRGSYQCLASYFL